MQQHRKLTDPDRAEIVRLYGVHGSTKPVADAMRCSRTTVRRVLNKRGVRLERGVGTRKGERQYSVPPVQPEQLDRVCEAGHRYAAWCEQRRELQRQEYGLPPDGRSL